MPTLTEIFEFIAKDEQLALNLFDDIDRYKDDEKRAIREILSRYLTAELADENGVIPPGAFTDSRLDEFERELIGYFDYDNLDPFLNNVLGSFQTRLRTIDDLIVDLELEGGILGDAVFELPVVIDEIDKIGNALVEARNGNGDDFDGALSNIKSDFARYRLDRSSGKKVLLSNLENSLRKNADVLPNYTNAIATTSLARIDRTLRRTQTLNAGLEYGKYVGPLDDITRPFCREQLEDHPVRKWTEWDALENNMTIPEYKSPVSKVGGGINCRHRIIPWMLEWGEGLNGMQMRRLYREAYRRVARAA